MNGKFKIFITILLSLLLFTSCSNLLGRFGISDNDYILFDENFQDILHNLNYQDKSGLKALFSQSVADKSETLDGDINRIMKFYKGNFLGSEGRLDQIESKKGGKEKWFKGKYVILTDKDTYTIYLIQQTASSNKDNVGLYLLQMQSESGQSVSFKNKLDVTGIYIP